MPLDEDDDPYAACATLMTEPGRLAPSQRERCLVEYRCKRRTCLAMVIDTPKGTALYVIRRDRDWPDGNLASWLPPAAETSPDAVTPLGGCPCHGPKTLSWAQVLEDIERARRGRVNPLGVTV